MARSKTTADRGAAARRFPALPPAPGRRAFASSWWGQAWVEALEDTSLDSGRLARGRTYARRGAVGEITVSPGRITAKVHGSAPRPYTSSVQIKPLTDGEWDRLLGAVAASGLHIAALLERDMPESLVEDADKAGVFLLPDREELEPQCSCPDWGYPCKHAAALCYQIARILDEDPFVLLLMRGRDENTIMAELQRRNLEHAAVEPPKGIAPTATGVPARDAFAAWRERPPVALEPIDPVTQPGPGAVLETADPPPGVDPSALEMLAADAAERAATLLRAFLAAPADEHDADPPPLLPALDARSDAIRLLAGERRDVEVFTRLAAALDFDPMHLVRAMTAWRHGGEAGLEALEQPWTPPSPDLARARTLLEAGFEGEQAPAPKSWRNRWTFEDAQLQLRYGRDGHWHPYTRRGDGAWWPAGIGSADPADLLNAFR